MSKIFLTCQWKNLAMVNFVVEPQILEPFVPAGTNLDYFRGKTLITFLGFQYTDAKIKGYSIWGHRAFAEINLRFYVKRVLGNEVRRGVCFLKELVGLPAVSWIANRCYAENFQTVPLWSFLEPKISGSYIQYGFAQSSRVNVLEMMATGEKKSLQPETIQEFIVNHRYAYSSMPDGQTLEYRVERGDWGYHQAGFTHVDVQGEKIYGPVLARVLKGQPDSAFWVDGGAVKVYEPQKLPYQPRHSYIIFDGVCHLCNGSVDFLLRHDRQKNFRLLANQTEKARQILSVFGFAEKVNDSVYLIQGGRVYRESTAGLRVLKGLGFPFSVFYIFIIVPSILRNLVYRYIARNRYRWFGKRQSCRMLPPQE